MCTCMCNWVTVLYSRKKNCIGEITIKNNNNKKIKIIIRVSHFSTPVRLFKTLGVGQEEFMVKVSFKI